MGSNKRQLSLLVIGIAIFLGVIFFASYAYYVGTAEGTSILANIKSRGIYTFTATPDGTLDIDLSSTLMEENDADPNNAIASDNANVTVSLLSGSDNEITTCTYDIVWEYLTVDGYTIADKTLGTNEYEFSVQIDKDNTAVLPQTDLSQFEWTGSKSKSAIIYSGSTTSDSASTATVDKYTITAKIYNLDVFQENIAEKDLSSMIHLTNVECTLGNQQQAIVHNDVIPEGGTYYSGLTNYNIGTYNVPSVTTYTEGQNFPSTVINGDVYVYGDYEYRYNFEYTDGWESNTSLNGWGVAALDRTKTNYGTILTTINGKDIKSLARTFDNCVSLVSAPAIPNGVTTMSWAFWGCTSLRNAPAIPSSVTNIDNAFDSCTSLLTAPVIPSSVTSMICAFRGCAHLTGTIEINSSTTSYNQALLGTQITDVTGTTPYRNEILATRTS